MQTITLVFDMFDLLSLKTDLVYQMEKIKNQQYDIIFSTSSIGLLALKKMASATVKLHIG